MNIKRFKLIVTIIITISLIFSIIISQDQHHLETCHDDHCEICNIIRMAQTIISISATISIYTFIAFLIFFLISRLKREKIIFIKKSLVFQKVQLNE